MQLTIILPTYREAAGIRPTLEALKRQLELLKAVELLVIDGGSDDGTVEQVRAEGVCCLVSEKGRARQMNFGAARATGDYLLFLHSDTQLPPDFAQWWAEVGRRRPVWGFFPVRLSGRGWPYRVIERAISWRSRMTAMATGDQAQFVHRDVWQQVGGFGDLALMEDLNLSRRLKALARPWVWSTPVVTSSRRWEENGVVRTVLLMWALRFAYWLGIPPAKLKRFY